MLTIETLVVIHVQEASQLSGNYFRLFGTCADKLYLSNGKCCWVIDSALCLASVLLNRRIIVPITFQNQEVFVGFLERDSDTRQLTLTKKCQRNKISTLLADTFQKNCQRNEI